MTNVRVTDILPNGDGVIVTAIPDQRFIGDTASDGIDHGTVPSGGASLYYINVTVLQSSSTTLVANEACFTADDGQNGCVQAWISVII